MVLLIPPELKKISPFIRRAEELDKDKNNPESRLVAYYSRQYAVSVGIPFAGSSEAAKTCLGELLGALEVEKPAMDNFTRVEAEYVCKNFAEKVFNNADAEDRNGNASRGTAKSFYAAGTFLQILDQFQSQTAGNEATEDDGIKNDESDQAAEVRKKMLYAKWKATEILKAIKEGRIPTPGGYGQDMAVDDESGIGGADGEEGETKDSTLRGADTPLQPGVETIENDNDDKGVMDLPLPPPAAPSFAPPSIQAPVPPPVPPSLPAQQPMGTVPPSLPAQQPMGTGPMPPPYGHDEVGRYGGEDQGTEVELTGPPPPSYGSDYNVSIQPPAPPLYNAPQNPQQQQQYHYQPPPAAASAPVTPPTAPTTPPPPLPGNNHTNQRAGIGSMFRGLRGQGGGKATKAQLSDATELVRFALAALEDRDADLASERLQQALRTLGR